MGCGCNKKKGNRQKSTIRKTTKGSVTKSSRQVMRDLWNKSQQVDKNTKVKKINKLTPRK